MVATGGDETIEIRLSKHGNPNRPATSDAVANTNRRLTEDAAEVAQNTY